MARRDGPATEPDWQTVEYRGLRKLGEPAPDWAEYELPSPLVEDEPILAEPKYSKGEPQQRWRTIDGTLRPVPFNRLPEFMGAMSPEQIAAAARVDVADVEDFIADIEVPTARERKRIAAVLPGAPDPSEVWPMQMFEQDMQTPATSRTRDPNRRGGSPGEARQIARKQADDKLDAMAAEAASIRRDLTLAEVERGLAEVEEKMASAPTLLERIAAKRRGR